MAGNQLDGAVRDAIGIFDDAPGCHVGVITGHQHRIQSVPGREGQHPAQERSGMTTTAERGPDGIADMSTYRGQEGGQFVPQRNPAHELAAGLGDQERVRDETHCKLPALLLRGQAGGIRRKAFSVVVPEQEIKTVGGELGVGGQRLVLVAGNQAAQRPPGVLGFP